MKKLLHTFPSANHRHVRANPIGVTDAESDRKTGGPLTWMKNAESLKLLLPLGFLIFLMGMPAGAEPQTTGHDAKGGLLHPGLLHGDEDFKRMRTHKDREPWKSGWLRLQANPHASADYKPRAVENVVRGQDRLATAPQNYALLFNDIAAAYANALRWRISDERKHAEKSIEIMNAWSATLMRLSGAMVSFKSVST